MAARKPRKPDYNGSLADYKESVKPASKKEKLYGQELGKIGRAAERGGPVNIVQQKMGAYSEQVMQNKALRDMPIKRKIQDLGLQLTVSAAINPNTFKGIQSGVARGINTIRRQEVWVHSSPQQGLSQITPQTSPGGRPRFQKETPLTFGVRTATPGTKEYLPEYIKQITTAYNSRGALGTAGRPQSVYVTKVPIKSIMATEASGKWGVSNAPQKVIREITIAGKSPQSLADQISAATKSAGKSFTPMKNTMQTIKSEIELQKALKAARNRPRVKKID